MRSEEFINDEEFILNIKNNYSKVQDVDSDVVVALRSGDHLAFEKIYTLYYNKIRGFISVLLHNKEEAREKTQEVFVALWENRERINPQIGIKGFLYRLARFECYKHFRHSKVVDKYRKFSEINEIDPACPDDIVIGNETALLLEIALDSMPARRREIFLLNREEGLSYDQIAELTGLSKNTVRNHIAAATSDLRKVITIFITLFVLP